MATIAEALSIAFAHHERGELPQAERIYRQIIDAEPTHADAWHLLGVVAHQSGRHAEGVELITRAVSLRGNVAGYYNHLGAAHAALQQLDQAEAAFRRAVQLDGSDSQSHFNLAALLNMRGRPIDAANSYRRAVALNPRFSEAHFNLGNLLRDQQQLEEAESCFAQALAARPNYLKAAMNLAAVQLTREEFTAAEATLRRALELDPNNAEAYYRLGSLWQMQDRLSDAVQPLQAAVFHNPRHVEAQNNLGCVFRSLQQLDQAESCFRLALAAKPDFVEAINNLGSVLHEKKDLAQAVDCFRRALELREDFVQAHNNLGTVLQEQKKFDEALAEYRRALEIEPNNVDALANFGSALQMKGDNEGAIDYYRRAIAADPQIERPHYALGAAFHVTGRPEEAIASYDEAIRLKPDYAEAHYNRSFVHLSQGDFPPGWAGYEWRFRCKDFKGRRFAEPLWDGTPLGNRTLLIHAEQGLGDTLHFIRYVRLVERLGGTVIVEVQPALVPLLRASGYTGVIGGGTPLPKFDVHVALLSLPGVMGTTIENLPASVPYLAADPKLLKNWRTRLRQASGFKVGIVWQGNASYTFDHFRSIPLASFAPLAETPGVQLVSLQKNTGIEQLAEVADRFAPVNLGESLDVETGAFMDTAAVMCNLDLIVTSDTAAAHLAGGLGVPVWLGVSAAPEWRWMRERTTSPWYPTMRLFRQAKQGDWSDVFAAMQAELAKLVAKRSSPS